MPVTEDDGECGHGAREVAGGHACDAEEVPAEHEEHAACARLPSMVGRGEGDERALWLDGDASGMRSARPGHARSSQEHGHQGDVEHMGFSLWTRMSSV